MLQGDHPQNKAPGNSGKVSGGLTVYALTSGVATGFDAFLRCQ